ncbi:MAG: ABC transporter substrate-binding protein [Treponemataceae bacterium]
MKKIIIIASLILSVFISCAKKEDDSKIKLVYWSMWNNVEAQGVVLERAIQDFEKKNPDVQIEINWIGRDVGKTLKPALDKGQTIDMWDQGIESVVKSWGEYALQLDSYVAVGYPETDGIPYENVVLQSLLNETRSFNADNNLLALPYQPFVFAFMYNKDHFAQAGATVPTTWDEFLVTCQKLKDAGFDPITTDDAYIDTLIGYYLARLKGPEWVGKLVYDKSLWNDEGVLQMAQAFEELAQKGYFSKTVASNKWPAGQQHMAEGKSSMYLNGTWLVNEVMASTGPDFPWGTFSFPRVPNGVSGLEAAYFGAQGFQINKDCKNPEIAFKLLVHLTIGQWDTLLAEESFGVPVAGTTSWPKQLSDAKQIFENLTASYPYAGGIQLNPNMQPIIAAGFTRLIGGQITAQEFIDAMQK